MPYKFYIQIPWDKNRTRIIGNKYVAYYFCLHPETEEILFKGRLPLDSEKNRVEFKRLRDKCYSLKDEIGSEPYFKAWLKRE